LNNWKSMRREKGSNLEEESVEKEAYGWEEKSEKGKKVEIAICRVRFMVPVHVLEERTHRHR